MMKKLLFVPMFIMVLLLAACTSLNKTTTNNEDMIVYESETGPILVPASPKRVVVLSSFNAGSVMALGVNIVGADMWTMANPRYAPYLQNAIEVSEDDLETILELEPDLIIAQPTTNNLNRLKEIAPTVTFTYGRFDYLTTHIEMGKLLNKEQEARAWVEDFRKRAQEAGQDIKTKIGETATVTVIESFSKQLYVFGDNWGRGTEILYQEMQLKMPEKVEEVALTAGYYALSVEVLPEYVGDYLIISNDGDDSYFKGTSIYQDLPAVKNNRVLEVNAAEFYFNDPITLEYQLELFIKFFLGE